jgi:hypothetical protein
LYFDTTDDQTTVLYFFPVKIFPVIIGLFVFRHDRWLSEINFNRQSDDCTIFFRVVIFSSGLKNIAGQTTVPFFFWVVIFSGHNWCSYFDTSTNYGTYIRPEKITTRKKGTVIWPAMFFGRFKLQLQKNTTRKKKGTVICPTVEINLR